MLVECWITSHLEKIKTCYALYYLMALKMMRAPDMVDCSVFFFYSLGIKLKNYSHHIKIMLRIFWKLLFPFNQGSCREKLGERWTKTTCRMLQFLQATVTDHFLGDLVTMKNETKNCYAEYYCYM